MDYIRSLMNGTASRTSIDPLSKLSNLLQDLSKLSFINFSRAGSDNVFQFFNDSSAANYAFHFSRVILPFGIPLASKPCWR